MLKTKRVISIILILIIILSLMPLKAMAVNGDIKDYNELAVLDDKYSYGQLISTDNTKIEIIESNKTLYKDAKDDGFRCYGLYINDAIKLKITNCSIDKQGRMCDVVIKVDNICPYSFLSKGGYSMNNIFENANEYIYAYLQICLKYNSSNVIAFWLSTNSASVDFNMTYYLASTNIRADISHNTSMFGDLDAQGNNFTARDEEKGNEFVKLLNNSGTFYYHKDYYMEETQTGTGIVSPRDINTSTGVTKNEFNNMRTNVVGNTNNYDLYSSTFLLQELNDSEYSFHYGGYGCGILYTFISPYTYKLTNPTKTVSKNIVKKNEKFYYEISQYIPNNYWSDYLSFVNNSGGLFSSVEISDKLDKNLKLAGDIEVTSSSGKNVTDYFDITTKSNAVRVSAKEEYLKSAYFYSQIYYVKIPVVIDDECDIKSVSNEATTTIVDKNESRVLTSSEVTTMIENTVTVNTEIDNGTISEKSVKKVRNGDDASYTVSFKPNYGYEVESVTIDGKQVSKEDLKSKNNTYSYNFIDKKVIQDIVHNIVVKTKLRDTKVIANYIDEKGVRIETSEEIKGKVFDEYTTEKKNIKYYTLKEKPSNETGEMTEDTIVVNYIYTRNKNNVTINYLENETNKELAETVKKVLDQGSRYNLKEEISKDIEYYSINRVDGKVKGIIEDDMIINVYYKRNKRNIIINFLDYMTKKVIAPVISKEQYQGTDYDVISEIAPNILYYTYKDTHGNTKGLLLENENINSYYIRNKNNVTIKYLEEKTKKELDKGIVLTLEQGTNYDITKVANKDIPRYKISKIDGDTKGFITENKEIIVYYKLKDSKVQVNHINEDGKILAKSEEIKGKVRR